MKAAVLDHYGSSDQFSIKQINTPEPKEGDILIRNHATSVNPVDLMVRQGLLRVITGIFGEIVIGCDYSGTVIQSRSSRFNVGDEVFGCMNPFTGHAYHLYAEMAVVNADVTVLKPTNLSFTEAACLPTTAVTAWQSLINEGELKAGDQVLINGCTGGVGCAAVQIAKSMGAVVTGTCRNEHVAVARELGCDAVIDYQIGSIPQDKRYNLILDTASKLTWDDVKNSLTDEGLFVVTQPHVDSLSSVITAAVDLARRRMKSVLLKPTASDLLKINELVEQRKLKPYIAKTFSLEQVAQAHKMQEEGGFVGKLAIQID